MKRTADYPVVRQKVFNYLEDAAVLLSEWAVENGWGSFDYRNFMEEIIEIAKMIQNEMESQ